MPRNLVTNAYMSKNPKQFHIPEPYRKPAMFALSLFRKGGYDLGVAINIAYDSFTNPKASDRRSTSEFNKKYLRSYLLDWLKVNSDYKKFHL